MAERAFELPRLLKSVAEQMWQGLSQSLVPHPGEQGTARGEIIREFLRSHLPRRFGVDTGFVFDSASRTSKQIDIVIYDAAQSPLFAPPAANSFFPVKRFSASERCDRDYLREGSCRAHLQTSDRSVPSTEAPVDRT